MVAVAECRYDSGDAGLPAIGRSPGLLAWRLDGAGIEEYMQVFGPKMSLLSLSIREGSAEAGVQAILAITDYGEFLERSGYPQKLSGAR